MTSSPWLVGVSGPIAAGKSTLVRALAGSLGFAPLVEEADGNPYLARYYREPEAWALENFLFFFEQSLTQQISVRPTSAGLVQERLPQEHLEVFGREFHARGYLADEDIALLDRLAATTLSLVDPPSLLVHLDLDPDLSLERIRARGRSSERAVTLDYLEALRARYESFLEGWNVSPILRIDAARVDVRRPQDVAEVADLVRERLPDEAATVVR